MSQEKLKLATIMSVQIGKWDEPRTPEDGPPDEEGEVITSYYIDGVQVTDEETINRIKQSKESK